MICVEIIWLNLLIVIAIVTDVVTATNPSLILCFGIVGGVHKRTHTIIIQTVGFYQIHYGESERNGISKRTKKS